MVQVAFAQKIEAAELVASQAEKRLADALKEKEELDKKVAIGEGKLEVWCVFVCSLAAPCILC